MDWNRAFDALMRSIRSILGLTQPRRPARHDIESVGTSGAAFLGEAERGPTTPQSIDSLAAFEHLYGDLEPPQDGDLGPKCSLATAVDGFFRNGGQRCYVVRVTAASTNAAVELPSTGGDPQTSIAWTVTAIGSGAWGGRIGVQVEDVDPGVETNETFRFMVRYWRDVADVASINGSGTNAVADWPTPTVEETYLLDPKSARSRRAAIRNINATSNLIRIDTTGSDRPAPTGRIQFLDYPESVDSAVTARDYQGVNGIGHSTGLAALEALADVAIVAIPDQARDAKSHRDLTDYLVDHCEDMGDRFAILGCPLDHDHYRPQIVRATAAGAYYTPWLEINDPGSSIPYPAPPQGHVAGVYARTDTDHGVHKAPANEPVHGIVGLDQDIDEATQATLTEAGINPIRLIPGKAILIWGARTASTDPERRYVPVQRLLIQLEESIYQGIEWVQFEPNEDELWSRVSRAVEDYLLDRWREGALIGARPEEAFYVRCGRTTMSDSDIQNGRLVMMIGVAPLRPAEFVILRFEHPTRS